MKLRSVELVNFRNHVHFSGQFSPTITLIHGENGTGKTSVLEAIVLAYRGSSFKGTDQEAVQHETQWFRVTTHDTTDLERVVMYDTRESLRQKRVVIGEQKSQRVPRRFLYPIVLFLPDDTRLINGSPARRREYFDKIIMQYNPTYRALVHRYERALAQRNKLLKRPETSNDDLFPWNIILSDTGVKIALEREQLAERIQHSIRDYYYKITGVQEDISLQYSHANQTSQVFLTHLEQAYLHDRQTGSTSVGPHRHDFLFTIRGHAADTLASRGEIRTIVLALKYIEADIIYELSGQTPLILLDDVFGELDMKRQKQLLNAFSENQVIITSTEEHVADTTIELSI